MIYPVTYYGQIHHTKLPPNRRQISNVVLVCHVLTLNTNFPLDHFSRRVDVYHTMCRRGAQSHCIISVAVSTQFPRNVCEDENVKQLYGLSVWAPHSDTSRTLHCKRLGDKVGSIFVEYPYWIKIYSPFTKAINLITNKQATGTYVD